MNIPDPQPTTSPLHAALEFLLAGVNVVPVREDGSKAPAGSWKQAQTTMTTPEQLVTWATNAQGFGIITGKVSGNLEMLELEGRAVAAGILDEARELAHKADIGDIWDKLQSTYIEMTPSGGIHWLYRIDGEVPGNTKLAQRPGANDNPECWIETRGEGGFVIVAPSGGTVHPSGKPWVRLEGKTPADIVTFTEDERAELHLLFMLFDEMPVQEEIVRSITTKIPDGNLSPGDDYNARTSWDELLIPAGWKKIMTMRSGETQWTRPGKDYGISATTGRTESDNLYVFSTSTQFEQEKPYSKWAVYTLFNFGSLSEDAFKQSTKALRGQGYGSIAVVPDYSLPAFQMPTNVDPDTGEVLEEGGQNRGEELMLAAEIQQQRIRQMAREHLKNEQAAKLYTPPTYTTNLAQELELPDVDTTWLINELFPTGSNILLAAAYKSGKTTLVNNFIKALADQKAFLGKFDIDQHQGRIVVFNYEVDERTYRRWLRDAGITNLELITLVHLRGRRMPLTVQHIEDQMVDILQELNCQTWIVDPFARAFSGSGDENSNSEVGVFLETLDVIKERAGVDNLLLTTHTGRAQENGIERARGATRLDDWADVRWLLNKNRDGARFLSASGRDVEMEERLLNWNPTTREVTCGEAIGRSKHTAQVLEDAIVDFIRHNPGCSAGAIKAACENNRAEFLAARKAVDMSGRILIVGEGNMKKFYVNEASVFRSGLA